ncbi:MAG: tRNA (guanosine(37)-N1)-methyltransferase TrmD [Campylobacter sp.]
MKFIFVTLFENLVRPYFDDSILRRAIDKKLIQIDFFNPRDFSLDKHKKVDDYMVGGGAGLLMGIEPLDCAFSEILQRNKNIHVVFLTPSAKKFTQNDAKRLAKKECVCFVCGRYEGIDERVVEKYANEVFSIGDFILTGGELPALCMADAISRNVFGVLGNEQSLEIESFEGNLLEAPSFTKPNNYRGLKAVSAFLKGDHAKITALKNHMAFLKTRFFRPDLYRKFKSLTKE